MFKVQIVKGNEVVSTNAAMTTEGVRVNTANPNQPRGLDSSNVYVGTKRKWRGKKGKGGGKHNNNNYKPHHKNNQQIKVQGQHNGFSISDIANSHKTDKTSNDKKDENIANIESIQNIQIGADLSKGGDTYNAENVQKMYHADKYVHIEDTNNETNITDPNARKALEEKYGHYEEELGGGGFEKVKKRDVSKDF